MEKQHRAYVPFFGALLVFLTLSGGVIIFWEQTYRILIDQQSVEIWKIFLIENPSTVVSLLGAVFSFFIAIIVYQLLATWRRAHILASHMTRELLTSREMFLQLYENAPVPYFLLSEKNKVHFPNKATLRLFGVVKEDFEDQNFLDLLPEEGRKRGKTFLGKFDRQVAVSDEEILLEMKDGSERWVILSILSLKRAVKKNSNGLVTMVDITERKKIDKAKTEFVSLASHQLRTPLSAIKWYTELLLSGSRGELNDKQDEYLNKVYDGNERMIELVNTLLNVSRLELGTLITEKKLVVLAEVVESVYEELLPKIEMKELNVIKEYDPSLEQIYTDGRMFRMIIQNLLSNSVKYTLEKGEVRITLKNINDKLHITVVDTGIGIPKNQQSQIFSKMFRADNAAGMQSEGNGLGLYIVKLATVALGGSISFLSEENKGTTFTVILPLS